MSRWQIRRDPTLAPSDMSRHREFHSPRPTPTSLRGCSQWKPSASSMTAPSAPKAVCQTGPAKVSRNDRGLSRGTGGTILQQPPTLRCSRAEQTRYTLQTSGQKFYARPNCRSPTRIQSQTRRYSQAASCIHCPAPYGWRMMRPTSKVLNGHIEVTALWRDHLYSLVSPPSEYRKSSKMGRSEREVPTSSTQSDCQRKAHANPKE